MNERSRREKPRLTLIIGGRMAEKQPEEAWRQAELKKFVAACERLYEKNRRSERRD